MFRQLFVLSLCCAILGVVMSQTEIECNRIHEHYDCGSACQPTCEFVLSGKPCPIVNIRCNDACYCDTGYARNGSDTATCIPICKCPK